MAKRLWDGISEHPETCPRGLRGECAPLARISSEGFASYFCCGETHAAPVPEDTMRFCAFSDHAHGIDVMVNFDERDATDAASVLLSGLSYVAQGRATEETP